MESREDHSSAREGADGLRGPVEASVDKDSS